MRDQSYYLKEPLGEETVLVKTLTWQQLVGSKWRGNLFTAFASLT